MTTIDDATLVQIAGDRPRPLLPVLDRARSYRPLIGVLAILPCLIALERRGLDDVGATWALHAVGGVESANTAALTWQPPLLVWIDRYLLTNTPLPPLMAPLLVSVLCTVGIVWWSFRLFSTDEEERLGFWTALCLAIQGALVLLATSASPTVLVLLLVLVTFDGWQRHFDETDSTVSPWLLIAGIAWGLTVLAGGSIGILIPAVLVIEQLLREAAARRDPVRTKRARIRRQQRIRWAFSLLVAVLMALAVCGWWVFQSIKLGGAEFLAAWQNGYDHAVLWMQSPDALNPGFTARVNKLIDIVGPLLPLAAIGAVRLASETLASPESRENSGGSSIASPDNRFLLLPWLMVGLVKFVISPVDVVHRDYLTFGEAFLLVPIAACASLAVISILQREVSLFLVVSSVGSTAVIVVATLNWQTTTNAAESVNLWLVALTAMTVAVIGSTVLLWSRDHERRRRIALLALLGVQAALVAYAGFQIGIPQPIDENRLQGFRDQLLRRQPDLLPEDTSIGSIVFVSETAPPSRLVFALHSAYPDAKWRTAKNWAAVTANATTPSSRQPGATLVIDWLPPIRQTAPVDLSNAELKPAADSRFYRGRELRAFLLVGTGR